MRPPRSVRTVFLALLLAALPSYAAGQERAEVSSCLGCHADLEGALAEPVGEWKQSVHARNGIGCASCHGGDPSDPGMDAMSPRKGFRGVPAHGSVPGFCGRCHAGVEEDYRDSAHGRALERGGPQCVTCHGAHAVAEATPEIINRDRCTACHEYGRADEIKGALLSTDALISRLDGRIGEFHRVGYETKEQMDRLFRIRNDFHRLFHTIEVERVRARTAALRDPLAELEGELAELARIRSGRRRIGAVVVGAFALLTALLALLRLSYRREERPGG